MQGWRFPKFRTAQEDEVCIPECYVLVGWDHNFAKQWKGTVIQFQLESFDSIFHLQIVIEVEVYHLLSSGKLASGNAEGYRRANLARGSSDRYLLGGMHSLQLAEGVRMIQREHPQLRIHELHSGIMERWSFENHDFTLH